MSTSYLIKNVAVLGGTPTDLLLEDGVIARRRRTATGRRRWSIDATGLIALPGLVDLHTHLREPGREDAETVESGTQAAALGGFTAVHAMANTEPVADTAGVVEQVWRLGREAGYCDVYPVGAVTVGLQGEQLAELGAMADSAARVRVFSDDGKCVQRPGADAPGAGVRQGVRRRHRPARPGAAAHRGRADERGRAVRPTRAGRLAGGRRGGDHRPRLPARRARRLPAARLPRLDRRLGRDRPLGQEQGLGRHRRGLPAPPAADRRARRDATTRSTRSTRRCARPPTSRRSRPAWPTAPSTSSPPTTRRTRTRTRTASGRPPRSACSASRPRCRSCSRRWSTPACSTGPASPSGCPTHRRGSAGSPTTAARSRWASRPTSCSTTRPRRRTVDPAESASLCRNTPYRGMELPGPGGRDVPAGQGHRARREARRDGRERSSSWRTAGPSAARRTAPRARPSARWSSTPA